MERDEESPVFICAVAGMRESRGDPSPRSAPSATQPPPGLRRLWMTVGFINVRSREDDDRRQLAAVDNTYGKTYAASMKTITASEARANLYKLLDETAVTSEPVQITGKRADAVLVSIDDWRAIEETLYLVSIPGMRASIRKGLKIPVRECLESLDW